MVLFTDSHSLIFINMLIIEDVGHRSQAPWRKCRHFVSQDKLWRILFIDNMVTEKVYFFISVWGKNPGRLLVKQVTRQTMSCIIKTSQSSVRWDFRNLLCIIISKLSFGYHNFRTRSLQRTSRTLAQQIYCKRFLLWYIVLLVDRNVTDNFQTIFCNGCKGLTNVACPHKRVFQEYDVKLIKRKIYSDTYERLLPFLFATSLLFTYISFKKILM